MSLNERKEAYKQIHIKAKALGMGEDAYRNTLKALTGFESCTDLRPNELNTVLRFFNAQQTTATAHRSTPVNHPSDCFCDECALGVLA
jgi:phage gp16-like protein